MPALLYVRGDPRELSAPQLAMVGSRSPTDAGRRTAQEFAAYLAQAGLTITSGLALGIDAASHAGALGAEGRTLAVLAHGLDRIYPQEHAGLAERIAAQGALVSEMPPGTPPLKRCFLRRNRLISGLSLGTLVIEAGRYSGALSTAHAAAEQGREVFAVPGSIHNPLAQGCHALIRGGAMLVESARDVLQELHIPLKNQMIDDDPGGSRASVPEDRMGAGFRSATLDKEYKILLDALGFEPVEIDRLVERSGLSSPAVASMLLILELEGLVRLQSDGRYLRMADA
jgi:DNA processing protein